MANGRATPVLSGSTQNTSTGSVAGNRFDPEPWKPILDRNVNTLAIPHPIHRAAEAAAAPATTSWQSRIVTLGAASIITGVLWDISWHRTIGRDTFWTPAHMAIYLGGVLGGLTAAWLVLRTTFWGSESDRAGSVRLWGFHGPLGAWVSIWGCLAMLTSAPFDNWWHDAYGLDVKILSPPHSVLALGMWAVVWGALLLVLREQNNAPDGRSVSGKWLYIIASGILVAMAAVFHTEESFPNQQHGRTFYVISCATFPLYLLALARASKFAWGATLIALVYMLIMAGSVWILPLFPGEPQLGPIYNRVTAFVPLPFPYLLVVPAVAIDLLRRWTGHERNWWRDWLLVIAVAAAFVALFVAVQWRFSEFLLGPGAANWFFGGDRHWGYPESPGPWRNEFWNLAEAARNPVLSARTLILLFGISVVSARLGLWLGNWMAKVRR